MNETRSLIAFFSRPGKNYVNGEIVNLQVGNTEVAAKMIQKLTGGDIFRINTAKTYPEGYQEATEAAKEELNANARPEIIGQVDNIADYGLIYLGYPIWWGTMPMAVFTFLEKYDLSGKSIAPFCTHEGSGMGRSERNIAQLCAGSRLLKGIALRGGNVHRAQEDIEKWLRELSEIA